MAEKTTEAKVTFDQVGQAITSYFGDERITRSLADYDIREANGTDGHPTAVIFQGRVNGSVLVVGGYNLGTGGARRRAALMAVKVETVPTDTGTDLRVSAKATRYKMTGSDDLVGWKNLRNFNFGAKGDWHPGFNTGLAIYMAKADFWSLDWARLERSDGSKATMIRDTPTAPEAAPETAPTKTAPTKTGTTTRAARSTTKKTTGTGGKA